MIRTLFSLLLSAVVCLPLFGQLQPTQNLALDDLSAFRPQAGNWSVVGKVLIHPEVDIHEPPPPPPVVEESSKKKKKRRRKRTQEVEVAPPPPRPKAVSFESGTGILLNINDDAVKDHLLTSWEHGDLLLELDVMIPKGSNSGIYLQGRYEVQLLDSWGVRDPAYSDIGGIYRNWETEKGQIYMGKAPITNAAKAPGLWQHLSIAFRAPRFDRNGRKTENARFIYVDLNGVRIHENLEVPLPTGGPVEKNEVPRGPLMIQGDHGPVAFRNIKYQLLEEKALELKDIEYQYFGEVVPDFETFQNMEPTAKGKMPQLNVNGSHPTGQFGMKINANLFAPAAGTYQLRFNHNGAIRLTLAGKTYTGNYRIGGEQYFTADLKAGDNALLIEYFKSDAWFNAGLGLFELGSFPRPLHAYESYPTAGRQAAPIYVEVGNKPRLLRAFLDFEGDRQRRLTHTIGVGTPGGTHFIYDLKAGTPVCAWRGDFVNATPMWNDRGDGSFRPRGAVQYLFAGSSVAAHSPGNTDFPAELNAFGQFTGKGYRIDGSNGLPVFLYTRDSLQLEDAIIPDDSGNGLQRSLRLIGDAQPTGYFAKLAEGDTIESLPNGIYLIDQEYYIRINSGQSATIRRVNGRQELISSLSAGACTYTIHW